MHTPAELPGFPPRTCRDDPDSLDFREGWAGRSLGAVLLAGLIAGSLLASAPAVGAQNVAVVNGKAVPMARVN